MPTVQPRYSVDFDRRCLADLGLTMPRLTDKYQRAIAALSSAHETSPYFFHVKAARVGTKAFYRDMAKEGWQYHSAAWHMTDTQKPRLTVPRLTSKGRRPDTDSLAFALTHREILSNVLQN